MSDAVRSVRGTTIRLTSERWFHIVEHHDDLAGYYHDVLETVGARMPCMKAMAVNFWQSRAALRHGIWSSLIVKFPLPMDS
jgi:hypothetical protein